jgi:hypothetical protein
MPHVNPEVHGKVALQGPAEEDPRAELPEEDQGEEDPRAAEDLREASAVRVDPGLLLRGYLHRRGLHSMQLLNRAKSRQAGERNRHVKKKAVELALERLRQHRKQLVRAQDAVIDPLEGAEDVRIEEAADQEGTITSRDFSRSSRKSGPSTRLEPLYQKILKSWKPSRLGSLLKS